MSAPDTNTKKQAKRHKVPLLGMFLAVVIAIAVLIWLLTSILMTEPEADGPIQSEATEESESVPAEGAGNGAD